jgi:glycine cleavage system H protein
VLTWIKGGVVGRQKYFAPSLFIRYFRCDLLVNDCNAQRTRFAARLPAGHLFTSSHFWLVPGARSGVWRVGMTEFALRMLGELVAVDFDCKPGEAVTVGKPLGVIEGFKAISDLYCVGTGVFEGGNPAFVKSLSALESDPYEGGWLYEFSGEPGPNRLDAAGYAALLGITMNRLLKGQCEEKP